MFVILEKERDVVCFPREFKMGVFSLLGQMTSRLWIGVKASAAIDLAQLKEQNWDLPLTICKKMGFVVHVNRLRCRWTTKVVIKVNIL